MDEQVKVSIERIKTIINDLEDSTFSTIDIVKKYSGGFYSNTKTAPYYSFNAQFGKLLKRNEKELGITEIEKGKSSKDDNGHETTTSIWEKRT